MALDLQQLDNDKYFGLIYKITNIINNKVYIGQTKRKLYIRRSGHLKACQNNHLKSAFSKYGISNFKWQIICYVYHEDQYFLDNAEKLFIAYYKSNNSITGYNKTTGGQLCFKLNAESIQKISIANKNKPPTERRRLAYINAENRKKISDGLNRYHSCLSEEVKQNRRVKNLLTTNIKNLHKLGNIAMIKKFEIISIEQIKKLNTIPLDDIINFKLAIPEIWSLWKIIKLYYCIDIGLPTFKKFLKQNKINTIKMIKQYYKS
jgi:group I intron endonuclease